LRSAEALPEGNACALENLCESHAIMRNWMTHFVGNFQMLMWQSSEITVAQRERSLNLADNAQGIRSWRHLSRRSPPENGRQRQQPNEKLDLRCQSTNSLRQAMRYRG
jgi:hypothetical protein